MSLWPKSRADRFWKGSLVTFALGVLAGVAGNKLTALIDYLQK